MLIPLPSSNGIFCLYLSAGNGLIFEIMADKLRAKFKVDSMTDFGYGSKQVKMSTVYSNTRGTEDNQFSQATPSGSLEMMVSAPGAQDFLKPGVKYILTFEEAEDQGQ